MRKSGKCMQCNAQPLTFFIISFDSWYSAHTASAQMKRNESERKQKRTREWEGEKKQFSPLTSTCCQSEKSALHIGAVAVVVLLAAPFHTNCLVRAFEREPASPFQNKHKWINLPPWLCAAYFPVIFSSYSRSSLFLSRSIFFLFHFCSLGPVMLSEALV